MSDELQRMCEESPVAYLNILFPHSPVGTEAYDENSNRFSGLEWIWGPSGFYLSSLYSLHLQEIASLAEDIS
jgi:hypothetical protein